MTHDKFVVPRRCRDRFMLCGMPVQQHTVVASLHHINSRGIEYRAAGTDETAYHTFVFPRFMILVPMRTRDTF